MANIELLAPSIVKWESDKYVNDPLDKGGPTKYGITLATWKSVGVDKDGDGDIDANDVKLLTKGDFSRVLRQYWDRWQADKIFNQSIADILVDWVWGSGKWGIVIPQRLLGLNADGVVGPKTIAAVNAQDPKKFFDQIFAARVKFINDIVANNPSQKKFIKGWMNRLNDFKYSV